MRKDMVAGLIVKDGKFLLVHNIKHGGVRIEPPGGKKEENETFEESIQREIKEELGIEVEIKSLFGTYNTESPEGGFAVKMYFCDITNGEPKSQEPEKIGQVTWYSIEEMEELANQGLLVPNLQEALPLLKEHLRGV